MPAHLLGPHVVGQRVVIRRIVPGETGPTGGPAFVDVLGVCRSWGDGVAVVVPESGVPVTIEIGHIVSGKPVPPRPSPRLRVSSREAERHSLPMWPHVERQALGEWELRIETHPTGRLLKRANSCLAIGDPGVTPEAASAAVAAFYAERGRQAMAQVEAGSGNEQALLDLGWRPLDRGEAAFQLCSVAQAMRALAPSDAAATVLQQDGPRLLVLSDGDDAATARAWGRAALDGDWIGIHSVGVRDDSRRRGLAQTVMRRLLDWGAEQGATTAWLHVETDNEPALALYAKLGFTTHHVCRYLTPPS